MRRVKATLNDIVKNGIEYHAYSRVTRRATGEKGYKYILSTPLTNEQKAFLSKFKNVVIGRVHYRYAPEIQYDSIILMDKCLKDTVAAV